MRPAGSSPLTRGKRGWRRKGLDVRRLIPAHAGKTFARVREIRQAGAHPRSRGENRRAARLHDRLGGLIPAHAGKTGPSTSPSGSVRAHPRSRGENVDSLRRANSRTGSSPLTRGKPVEEVSHIDGGGLIPAHAGKTGRWQRGHLQVGAHPRSRGENLRWLRGLAASAGSSPLTRGKRPRVECSVTPPGLIPAHAGKT